MQTMDRTVRCNGCGAKNPAGTERCRICTRILPHNGTESEAQYEKQLYAKPVSTGKGKGKALGPTLPILVVVVALGLGNYLWFGYGPSWAHQTKPPARGSSWVTDTDSPAYRAVVPGRFDYSNVDSVAGSLHVGQLQVDSNWDMTVDATVTAPAVRLAQASKRWATVMIAEGSAVDDLSRSGAWVVNALMPQTTFSSTKTVTVRNAANRPEVDVTAGYTTSDNTTGTVMARIVESDGRLYVVASFVQGGSDPALQHQLVSQFSLS